MELRTIGMLPLLIGLAAGLPATAQSVRLGPKDGADLPAADTGRVAVGDIAPDFALESLEGPVVTLSALRGGNIVLVFYRGHW